MTSRVHAWQAWQWPPWHHCCHRCHHCWESTGAGAAAAAPWVSRWWPLALAAAPLDGTLVAAAAAVAGTGRCMCGGRGQRLCHRCHQKQRAVERPVQSQSQKRSLMCAALWRVTSGLFKSHAGRVMPGGSCRADVPNAVVMPCCCKYPHIDTSIRPSTAAHREIEKEGIHRRRSIHPASKPVFPKRDSSAHHLLYIATFSRWLWVNNADEAGHLHLSATHTRGAHE